MCNCATIITSINSKVSFAIVQTLTMVIHLLESEISSQMLVKKKFNAKKSLYEKAVRQNNDEIDFLSLVVKHKLNLL